ncbi:hypothetical protein PRJ39_06080 [Lysobacter enzymogenes]|uniref:hypothetical protein n=1 Tax=Lysobacter enzymogenes TaxID=69 RepID=UPI003748F946
MTQDFRSADRPSEAPWPLTFDSFSFGSRVYNTLHCNIIFQNQQHALPRELSRPSGVPKFADWKERWTGSFLIVPDEMPPGPVQIQWASLDGAEHSIEIDLIQDVFPGQVILHQVPREEVWELWSSARAGHTPDILLEVNDRTVTVYMRSVIYTRIWEGKGDEARRVAHDKLIQAWTRTF